MNVLRSIRTLKRWLGRCISGKPHIILITGASGAGKTTTLKAIEKTLASNKACFFYFDDVGVPSEVEMIGLYGSRAKWQEAMTNLLIAKIAAIRDKKLIFLEGSFNPEYALPALKKRHITNVLILCLHTEQNLRECRLIHRPDADNLVHSEMENWATFLKKTTRDIGGIVIETKTNDTQAMVLKVIEAVLRYLLSRL